MNTQTTNPLVDSELIQSENVLLDITEQELTVPDEGSVSMTDNNEAPSPGSSIVELVDSQAALCDNSQTSPAAVTSQDIFSCSQSVQ